MGHEADDQPTYKVFICYRRTSSQAATSIYRELRHRLGDESVFMDRAEMVNGLEWRSQLHDVLTSPHLRCFVLVVSPDLWSVGSDPERPRWGEDDIVLRELRYAVERARQTDPPFWIFWALEEGASVPDEQSLEAAPPGAQEVLTTLLSIDIDDLRTVNPEHLEVLAAQIERSILQAEGRTLRSTKTIDQVLALSDIERVQFRETCEFAFERGHDKLRSRVLLALLKLADDVRASGLDDLLRPVLSAGIAPVGQGHDADAYWGALGHLAFGIRELGGERPRRLANLRDARVLVLERLLPAMTTFASLVQQPSDPSADLASPGPDDARAGLRAAAAVFDWILEDYFDTRGLVVLPSVQADAQLRADMHALRGPLEAAEARRELQAAGLLANAPSSGLEHAGY